MGNLAPRRAAGLTLRSTGVWEMAIVAGFALRCADVFDNSSGALYSTKQRQPAAPSPRDTLGHEVSCSSRTLSADSMIFKEVISKIMCFGIVNFLSETQRLHLQCSYFQRRDCLSLPPPTHTDPYMHYIPPSPQQLSFCAFWAHGVFIVAVCCVICFHDAARTLHRCCSDSPHPSQERKKNKPSSWWNFHWADEAECSFIIPRWVASACTHIVLSRPTYSGFWCLDSWGDPFCWSVSG